MPLKRFVCPDGIEISVGECLEVCRLPRRCLTRSTLRVIVEGEREWDGVPHVTSLLNGTMAEYLKITCEYAVRPDSRAFMLLGSVHHRLLEDGVGSEIALAMDLGGGVWMQGKADLLERDGDEMVLSDFKTWGSYRVMRALGLEKIGKGKEATYRMNPGRGELQDEQLQLNAYRVMVEQSMAPVDRLQLQVTVRDGGIKAARESGVERLMYVIPVEKLVDGYVVNWFGGKAEQLRRALDGGEVVMCTPSERWDGRKCGQYCEVSQFCVNGVK